MVDYLNVGLRDNANADKRSLVPTSDIFYVGLMVKNNAGTEPTASGLSVANAATTTKAPILAGD